MSDLHFSWDARKAAANLRNHGVSFAEAETVFFDTAAVQFWDDTHSELAEDRFLLLGMSACARLLLIVYCARDAGNTVRIISARKASRHETQFYGKRP